MATTSMYSGLSAPIEHAAFVAGADDADAQPVVERRAVVEVNRAEARRGGRAACQHGAFQKVAPRRADGLVEVLLADLLFFGR